MHAVREYSIIERLNLSIIKFIEGQLSYDVNPAN